MAVDHCNGLLYTNDFIAQASYFSVSLFVLLSGISLGISSKYKKITFIHQFKKVCLLFLQYSVATLILLVYYSRFFDLKIYISHILNFSIQGPYYFLVFFFQLMLVAPYLICWNTFCNSSKWKYAWNIVTILSLCYCSSLFIRYTNILPVHGGGKYILGGTYIILYYLGIMFGNSNLFDRLKKQRVLLLICSIFCWLFWWLMCSYNKLPFDEWVEPYYGDGFNPPSIEFMIFAIITLFMLYSFFSLLEEQTQIITQKVISIFTFFGRNTLHIFMYHLLVKDIVLTYFSFICINEWMLRVCVFIPMISLPVFVIYILRKGMNYCRFFYR